MNIFWTGIRPINSIKQMILSQNVDSKQMDENRKQDDLNSLE